MKKYLFILVNIIVFFGFSFKSQSITLPIDVTKEIIAALNSGNSKDIAKFFNNTIDLTVPGNEGTYSKVQAELILKNFFLKHKVKSFSLNHQGSSKEGSQFIIGTLITSNGNFRTYCYLKKLHDEMIVQQLQFDKN